MQLSDILHQMMEESVAAGQPCDLCTGTVTSAAPLEITMDTTMAPLRAPVLYLTEAVVEKKLPVLQHTHTIRDTYTGGGTCEPALGNLACVEHGTALPVRDGYIILNRALAAGDRVLLLRVQHGQKFIVLSRTFKGGA